MIFQRIKSEGLAHNSYLIGSVELNNFTGAEIYHGPDLNWKYGNALRDGQELLIGNLKLTAIHTHGHTDESMSYAVADLSSGEAMVMVFAGDALFVDDVGRTDLYGTDEAPRLASNLYDSIFKELLPVGDGVILCPAHGAGSVCGLNIGDRDESTLGIERAKNPILQKSRCDFIKYKVSEQPERPHYFRQMEKYNLEGPPLLGGMPLPTPLTPTEFRGEMEKGAVVVDTNEPAAFGGAHIKGAYSIWLGGLPVFAGWVLSYDKPILLVLENQCHLEKAVRYLVRAGYDQITGYRKVYNVLGSIKAWLTADFPITTD